MRIVCSRLTTITHRLQGRPATSFPVTFPFVTKIRAHITGTSPSPHYGACLQFFRETAVAVVKHILPSSTCVKLRTHDAIIFSFCGHFFEMGKQNILLGQPPTHDIVARPPGAPLGVLGANG